MIWLTFFNRFNLSFCLGTYLFSSVKLRSPKSNESPEIIDLLTFWSTPQVYAWGILTKVSMNPRNITGICQTIASVKLENFNKANDSNNHFFRFTNPTDPTGFSMQFLGQIRHTPHSLNKTPSPSQKYGDKNHKRSQAWTTCLQALPPPPFLIRLAFAIWILWVSGLDCGLNFTRKTVVTFNYT